MGFPSHYNGLVFHSPSLVKTFEKVAQPIPQDCVCATADLQEWCPMAVSSTRRCTPVHRAVEKRTSININTPRWGVGVSQPAIINKASICTIIILLAYNQQLINMRSCTIIGSLNYLLCFLYWVGVCLKWWRNNLRKLDWDPNPLFWPMTDTGYSVVASRVLA